MKYSTKRQQYLIDQGYTFKVVQDLVDKADRESILLKTVTQEIDLLNKVITYSSDKINELDNKEKTELNRRERGEVDEDDNNNNNEKTGEGAVKRKFSSFSAMSGGAGTLYTEFES